MSGSIEMDKCDFCQEIKQVERTYLKPSKYVKEQGAFINNTLYNQGDYFIIVKTCADCGTPAPSQTLKENHIVDTNEMVSSQTEISDESWEGCDGCTEQDKYFWTKGYQAGYNRATPTEISDDRTKLHWKTSLVVHTPEISDEEIEKQAENAWSDYEYEEGNLYSTTFKGGWKLAIKWYREQLKQKQ